MLKSRCEYILPTWPHYAVPHAAKTLAQTRRGGGADICYTSAMINSLIRNGLIEPASKTRKNAHGSTNSALGAISGVCVCVCVCAGGALIGTPSPSGAR